MGIAKESASLGAAVKRNGAGNAIVGVDSTYSQAVKSRKPVAEVPLRGDGLPFPLLSVLTRK